MNILLVASEAPPIKSGISRVVAELKDGLEERGHQVDTLSSVDIPRYNIGEFRLSTLLFQWKRFCSQLDNYDLINVHAPVPTFSDFFLLLASRFGLGQRKSRIIMTYQCEVDLPGLFIKPLTRFYSWMHKKLSRLTTHTIVTTPSYADMFKDTLPPSKLSIIPWAVDDKQFGATLEQKSDTSFQILFVGQLRPYKGLDVLLKAMKDLPKAKLKVIGDGHHAETYHQMAESLGLTNVTFMGKVSDDELQEALKESHTLVLPSLTKAEAFGIVLLEAMAAGCVPIASDLPGVCDVVKEVGFTFPTGDVRTLSWLLDILQAHPSVTKERAYQAQLKAQNYTWKRCVDAHENLFRQILTSQEGKTETNNRLQMQPMTESG